jgi:flavin reductase (DIM6/NTAB) family NADH-FMN oxidoreductase RutF
MEKTKISNDVSWQMPVVLIGTVVDNVPNFSAVAWITRLSSEPPMLGFTIDAEHHSAKGIFQNKAFSVNFPPVSLVEKVDFCGIYSGKNTKKADLFSVYYGNNPGAPLIDECPLVLECEVLETSNINGDLFVKGEIKESYAYNDMLKGNKIEFSKVDPILYIDKKYYKTGSFIGQAWSIGKKIKEDIE